MLNDDSEGAKKKPKTKRAQRDDRVTIKARVSSSNNSDRSRVTTRIRFSSSTMLIHKSHVVVASRCCFVSTSNVASFEAESWDLWRRQQIDLGGPLSILEASRCYISISQDSSFFGNILKRSSSYFVRYELVAIQVARDKKTLILVLNFWD